MPEDFLERLIAGRWIAGSSIESAEKRVLDLNSRGLTAILNYLGEHLTENDEIRLAKIEYCAEIDRIKRNGLKADIALKATALGLLLGRDVFVRNYLQIVKRAKKRGVFVWLDMEEHEFVDDTIAAYKKAVRYGNTGICIQSYMKRSLGDMKELGSDAVVRLVKGAYSAPAGAGFRDREGTTRNYVVLMEYLFKNFSRFTIGTHDISMVGKAMRLNKRYGRDVTYAMLNGIRDNYAYSLAQEGYKVSIYVPFGRDWMGYAWRRLKEASGMKLFLMSIFGSRAAETQKQK